MKTKKAQSSELKQFPKTKLIYHMLENVEMFKAKCFQSQCPQRSFATFTYILLFFQYISV